MGLLWAVGWAILGGGVMEGIFDRDGAILDMWPQTLGMAGFIGGLAFSMLLLVAGSRRRFDELSYVGLGGLGVAAGVILGGFMMTTGAGLMVMVPMVVLCAASACGSLALARKAEKRELLDAG
jgi:peptidoglycan/LPS O-acetylase OafA/YrhL